MPRLVGFAWEEAKEKGVCWGTPNGNLAEASVQSGGAWQLTALNAVSNAPLASLAGITAYSWPSSKQVSYLTQADDHIHEIYFDFGGSQWKHADLTQLAGAPPCSYRVMSGYGWNKASTKQVAYVTADGHIHELYVGVGGSWKHADLTQITGAPSNAGSLISGYSWENGDTKQVVYKDVNGHIHELYVGVGGSWKHADLTQLAGAPVASGHFLAGFAWEEDNTKQVTYVTNDGHIHELYVSAKTSWKWTHADLTIITGSPTGIAIGESFAAYAWPDGGTKQVAFLGSGCHIHELYVGVGGSWKHADLTQLAGAPDPDTSGYFSGYSWKAGKSKQVVYTTGDGHVHELYVQVGGLKQWKDFVLPGLTH
jgi:hypothetical protein